MSISKLVKLFFKYTTFAFGIQAVLLIFLTLVGNWVPPIFTLVEILLQIYLPFIVFIAEVGKFKGESAMIEPVWMGTSLAVALYSLVFGFAMMLLKRHR